MTAASPDTSIVLFGDGRDWHGKSLRKAFKKRGLNFRLPVILYPIIFMADLFAWLYYAGHSLDPHAPMSSSIKEFTPKIFGTGTIGQFHTEAEFTTGFYLAAAAAVITMVVAIWERWGRHARSQ